MSLTHRSSSASVSYGVEVGADQTLNDCAYAECDVAKVCVGPVRGTDAAAISSLLKRLTAGCVCGANTHVRRIRDIAELRRLWDSAPGPEELFLCHRSAYYEPPPKPQFRRQRRQRRSESASVRWTGQEGGAA